MVKTTLAPAPVPDTDAPERVPLEKSVLLVSKTTPELDMVMEPDEVAMPVFILA